MHVKKINWSKTFNKEVSYIDLSMTINEQLFSANLWTNFHKNAVNDENCVGHFDMSNIFCLVIKNANSLVYQMLMRRTYSKIYFQFIKKNPKYIFVFMMKLSTLYSALLKFHYIFF